MKWPLYKRFSHLKRFEKKRRNLQIESILTVMTAAITLSSGFLFRSAGCPSVAFPPPPPVLNQPGYIKRFVFSLLMHCMCLPSARVTISDSRKSILNRGVTRTGGERKRRSVFVDKPRNQRASLPRQNEQMLRIYLFQDRRRSPRHHHCRHRPRTYSPPRV